ncbi:MAG: hypothetical protein IAE83_03890 [Anaerolinea sp.]|nr:hypothetical protein [Anaerolinea sp.]CAG1015149.1 hypothetical protein ANRL4_05411 [Anaerolineae bacterium]
MAKSGKSAIEEKARELGMEPEEYLRKLLAETGSLRQAALRLGRAENAIRYFMKRRGLRITRRQIAVLEKKTS